MYSSKLSSDGSAEGGESANVSALRSEECVVSGPNNHLALIYETRAEQLASVIPFVREGLEQNDQIVYIADERSPDEIWQVLSEAGIDTEAARESGALTVTHSEDLYADDTPFSPEEMIANLEDLAHEATGEGEFNTLRITGEMTWALGMDGETQQNLVRYESKLNEALQNQPINGVCQYNQSKFDANLLQPIVRAHPYQVYDATVIQNPTYVPPAEFDANEPPVITNDDFLQSHLERVRAHAQRKQYELALASLSDATESVFESDAETVITNVIDSLKPALNSEVIAVYEYEDSTDTLEPAQVWTAATGDAQNEPLPAACRELVRTSFTARTPVIRDDQTDPISLPNQNTHLYQSVAYYLGQYGGVFIGSTNPDRFTSADLGYIQTVAHAADAAMQRIKHGRLLDDQTIQLQHLNKINRTIRRLLHSLVQTTHRREIETHVCEQLADTGDYQFVWIGEFDLQTDGIRPVRWAGDGEVYLDEVYGTTEGEVSDAASQPLSPARDALETQSRVFVPNTLTTKEYPAWRRAALANETHSVVSIPLIHNSTEYGVLNVYSETPNGLGQMECDVLDELGATIAYAIDNAETKAGLHSDRRKILGLSITDSQSCLYRFATKIDGRVEVETLIPNAEDELRLFFTCPDVPPDTVKTVGEGSKTVRSIRQITQQKHGALFEAVIKVRNGIPRILTDSNGSVRELVATPVGIDLTVDLPHQADTSALVERLRDVFSDVTVTSLKHIDKEGFNRGTFFDQLRNRLTEKQWNALQVAYHSGYFEWPRDSSATDVAQSMGVTQPTFTGHLRAGERKLMEMLFSHGTNN